MMHYNAIDVVMDTHKGFWKGHQLAAGIEYARGSTEINTAKGRTIYMGLNPDYVAWDTTNKRYVTVAEQITHALAHNVKKWSATH